MEEFNESIQKRIGDDVKPDDELLEYEFPAPPESLFEDHEAPQEVLMNRREASSPDIDDLIAEANDSEEEFTPDGDIYDEYIGNQVMMKEGDRRLKCVIFNRIKDKYGNPVGKRNSNPSLDTRE